MIRFGGPPPTPFRQRPPITIEFGTTKGDRGEDVDASHKPPPDEASRPPAQSSPAESTVEEALRGEGQRRPIPAIELKRLMREVAQLVKRPDVGEVLVAAEVEDPLAGDDSVPKRKRITAALIATDHREPDNRWVDRLLAVVDAYDEAQYVEKVGRLAEHVLELDAVRQVAPRVPAWVGDDRDVSAHVGLTFWGGSGRIARNAVLLVRECNRETQIELDAEGTAAVLAGLSRAHRQLEDSNRYLAQRQQGRRARS